jgi:hypothetical protein
MTYLSSGSIRKTLARETPLLVAALRSRRTLLAAAVGAGGLVVYYSHDWLLVRSKVAELLVWALCLSGISADASGPVIVIRGVVFTISRDCLYLDWLMMMLPFLWFQKSAQRNVVTVLLGCVGAMAINGGRVVCALYMHAVWRWEWVLCHDIPDYMIWYGGLSAGIAHWVICERAYAAEERSRRSGNAA